MRETEVVLNAAKGLYEEKLVAGTSGNISMRKFDGDNESFLITPSGFPYRLMTEEDIVEIDVNGIPKKPGQKPSSEWRMHLEVYKKYPNINAIVHTHSPFATGFAVNRQDIPLILIEMKPFLGGEIKVAPFKPAGSLELGQAIIPYLEKSNSCLLANHGTISCGKTMEEAYTASVYVEDAAKIYYYAKTSGNPVIIE
ncbi:class II aldolase/adducin family protein [Clostridium sp. OS1-26]|uniref:class II aldolase/adducin family protein n=1 Tax=Clostridium sp. OS1-26 TaxID=3070681 RepID=UPI0027DF8D90|nr:class II aldolase/adducin family protein [Clostridium sp. OS1-26]WML32918.1 class II aldolase/adducin family protein [Clostridium sp. OS1-26]